MKTAYLRLVGLIGSTANFALRCFLDMFRPPCDTRDVLKHLDDLGAKSLPLVGTTGLVVGLILAIQSRPILARFCSVFSVPFDTPKWRSLSQCSQFPE